MSILYTNNIFSYNKTLLIKIVKVDRVVYKVYTIFFFKVISYIYEYVLSHI